MRSAALVGLLLTGCPPDDGPKVCSGFVGSMALAPEIEIVARGLDGTVIMPPEGGSLPLLLPPQGGRVVFVAARARNLDTCGLQIIAAVRDECSNRVVGLEGRPIFLLDAGDGWAVPANPLQLSNFANVALCPNTAGSRDIQDEPYLVEVSVEDSMGRKAAAKAHLVPFCADPEMVATCRCTCSAGYVLGQTCGEIPDAGGIAGACPVDAGGAD